MATTAHTVRRTGMTALAVAAALGVLAAPASALPPGGGDPPDPIALAELSVTSLSVAPVGTSWSIAYTVRNSGSLAAPATTVAFNGTGGVTASRSVPPLAIGATSSGVVQVARTDCYVLLNATADSANVVREVMEYNNTRSAKAALPGCPPRYRITPQSYKALDESGPDWSGSDEPYWTFSSVSTGGTGSTSRTGVGADVDTGETVNLGGTPCIFGCGAGGALAPLGIGLSIQAWEHDGGNVDQVYFDIADQFKTVGDLATAAGAPAWVAKAGSIMTAAVNYILKWYADDLLGKSDFTYAPEFLAATLPAAGASVHDQRQFGDSSTGASYSLDLLIQRIV